MRCSGGEGGADFGVALSQAGEGSGCRDGGGGGGQHGRGPGWRAIQVARRSGRRVVAGIGRTIRVQTMNAFRLRQTGRGGVRFRVVRVVGGEPLRGDAPPLHRRRL